MLFRSFLSVLLCRKASGLGWIGIWDLHGSRTTRSLPQQQGPGGRGGRDGRKGNGIQEGGVLVGDGSRVHQASRSSSGTQRMGVFLDAVHHCGSGKATRAWGSWFHKTT